MLQITWCKINSKKNCRTQNNNFAYSKIQVVKCKAYRTRILPKFSWLLWRRFPHSAVGSTIVTVIQRTLSFRLPMRMWKNFPIFSNSIFASDFESIPYSFTFGCSFSPMAISAKKFSPTPTVNTVVWLSEIKSGNFQFQPPPKVHEDWEISRERVLPKTTILFYHFSYAHNREAVLEVYQLLHVFKLKRRRHDELDCIASNWILFCFIASSHTARSGCQVAYRDCDYRDCDYGDCDYRDCDYGDCDYRDCDYGDCDYRDCDYRDCDYRDCVCINYGSRSPGSRINCINALITVVAVPVVVSSKLTVLCITGGSKLTVLCITGLKIANHVIFQVAIAKFNCGLLVAIWLK